MTTVERKEKLNIQISFDPFLLFVLTSVLLHGLGLAILILSNRSLPAARQEIESTPIDFVVIPPEESTEEPPPDTERRAVNNSIAKGRVDPDLPSATNKIGNEEAIVTSQSSKTVQSDRQNTPPASVVPPTPTPPRVESTTSSKAKPPAPPPSLPKIPKPAKTESPSSTSPTPPLSSTSEPPAPPPSLTKIPKPAIAQSSSTPPPEEIKPTPTVVNKSKPIEKTPLLSETDSSSIPLPKLEPLPEKIPAREIETATPPPELPPLATKLPPKLKPLEPSNQSEKIPAREIETATPPPELPPPATKLPSKAKPLEPSSAPIENTSVPPESPSTPSLEQQTPVGSGSASLLGGTYRKSLSEDSGSSFLNPQANASQQALNSSGLDARQDLNMGPYFEEIRRRVRRNWQPSAPHNNRHTVLAFSIQRNGQITGLRVRQSSGSEKIDRESLEAVQKAGPFAALPANFPNELLDVVFSFNIYVNQGVFTPQLENWQRF